VVQEKLEIEWTLEQIVARLRMTFPDRGSRHLIHETIYQAITVRRGALNRDVQA
jgi:IS30 family transposase